MKSLFNWNKIKPHAIALGIFFVAVFIFCKPSFEDKVILTTDGVQFSGMYNNMANSVEAKENKTVYWNKSLFSGMPFIFYDAELISPISKVVVNGILSQVWSKLMLNGIVNWTAIYFVMACIGFYILLSVLSINYVIAIIGSLAFAYSTQNAVLVIAGHHTKLIVLFSLPITIAGIILITQKKYWIGSILTILSFAYAVAYEHYQMVFYALICIFFVSVFYLGYAIKNKISWKHILFSGTLVALSVGIAFSFFIPKLISYQEYAKETIRGGSKIIDKSNTHSKLSQPKTGLDKEYAFNWSYGTSELLTFISPDVYGGASGGRLGEQSESYKKLTDLGVSEENALNIVESFDTYWGKQPFTLGPIYFGVIIMALSILAIIYVRSWLVWSLITLAVISSMIALGKNFSTLNYFLFDYLPYYNKFRAPTMILTATQFAIMLLASIGLQHIFITHYKTINKEKLIKQTAYILGSFVVLVGLFYFNSSFSSPRDSNFLQQLTQMAGDNKEIATDLLKTLRQDRKSMLSGDLIKLIFFSLLFLGLIYAYIKEKLTTKYFILIVGIAILVDAMQASRDYINYDKFKENPYSETGSVDKLYPKSNADEIILKDKDLNFRVFDISTGNAFNDASVSYYHRSVGGYHAAKLAIYQDLIDSQLYKMNMSVLNMLNTRYFIQANNKGQKIAVLNPDACGPCWFVKEVKIVNDTREEMMALNNFIPTQTAFVEKSYENLLTQNTFIVDTHSKIINTYTSNNTMKYESESVNPEFAVFSEIFYDKGWKALIDGKFVPTVKTNYVLRGLQIPAGKHKIEFIYELDSLKKGIPYQTAGSSLFIIILLCAVYFNIIPLFKKK